MVGTDLQRAELIEGDYPSRCFERGFACDLHLLFFRA
jgi:hypothetical protein